MMQTFYKWYQRLLITLLVTNNALAFSIGQEFLPENHSESPRTVQPVSMQSLMSGVIRICGGLPESQLGVITTTNGDNAQVQQGQGNGAPPPPPKVQVIDARDGSYSNNFGRGGDGWQPPEKPQIKPERIKYNGITIYELLFLTLQYVYAHQEGNLVHTILANFLQTETMHFSSSNLGGMQTFAAHFQTSLVSGQTAVENLDQIVGAYTASTSETESTAQIAAFIDGHYADHQIVGLVTLFRSCMRLKPLSQ